MLHLHGTPRTFDISSSSEVWYYDVGWVRFSRPDGQVIKWSNSEGLKARLFPTTSESSTPGYITLGSSKDDVLHLHGTPRTFDISSSSEVWYYDVGWVRFSRPDGQVIKWSNSEGLKARLFPTTSESSTPGYITLGSSKDDVLHLHGTPRTFDISSSSEVWYYGVGWVRFSRPDGQVIKWSNSEGLKARLFPTTSEASTPGYITLGSSKDDVLHLHGTPRTFDISSSSEVWYYDVGWVRFSRPDGQVIKWSNSEGLKARLFPTTSEASTPGYITLGSSKDDVLHLHGTPRTFDISSSSETWYYDVGWVRFSRPDGQVIKWSNSEGLKARLFPTTSESSTPGYITLGSSKDDVLHLHGTPRTFDISSSSETWYYDAGWIRFSRPDGQVTKWSNSEGLKARLFPTDDSE